MKSCRNVPFRSGRISGFSRKQMTLLTWWCEESPLSQYAAVICDGAVRSGKTLCMSISFLTWAFASFDGASFAFCGKTIASLRRNVITPLLPLLRENGFTVRDYTSKNVLELAYGGRVCRFYLFGGKDESSASLIQGVTLGGVMLDEAALMPRSFVEQALARCSLTGARLWFNCNPEHPFHWFYLEWIQKAKEKNALYLHFTMEDNPSLSDEVRERYRSLYSGRFYRRFILGEWVAAQGLIYPSFSPERHLFSEPPEGLSGFAVSCDYGTVNPTSMGLWGRCEDVWYRIAEYYFDSRREGFLRTDEEHYRELCRLAEGYSVSCVVVDPSAASFLECIRRHGQFCVIPARNDVLDGIRRVSSALQEDRLRFSEHCIDTIREFSEYVWDERAHEDRPVKEHDHAMDDLRYFVSTVLSGTSGEFYAASVRRTESGTSHRKHETIPVCGKDM